MSVFWFALFILLLLVEIFTINLVSIWFAVAALVCGFLAIWMNNVLLQIVVFIVVSIITLLLTKPFMKKVRVKEVEPTNLDRVIGKEAIVIETITKDKFGEVKIFGTVWTASCNTTVEKGSRVVVKKIDGVKLVVEKKEEK